MFEEYTQEQLRKLFFSIPEELREASSSIENSNLIDIACKHAKLSPENIKGVIELIGFVFIGLLPLEEFKNALTKELKIKKPIAEKLYQEIHITVFSPVKYQLHQLYEQGAVAGEITSEQSEQEFKEKKQYGRERTKEKILEEKNLSAMENDFENIEKQTGKNKEKITKTPKKEPVGENIKKEKQLGEEGLEEKQWEENQQSTDSYRESIE